MIKKGRGKDKTKRKSRLKKILGYSALAAGGLALGAYLGKRKPKTVDLPKDFKININVEKTAEDFGKDMSERLKDLYPKQNSDLDDIGKKIDDITLKFKKVNKSKKLLEKRNKRKRDIEIGFALRDLYTASSSNKAGYKRIDKLLKKQPTDLSPRQRRRKARLEEYFKNYNPPK